VPTLARIIIYMAATRNTETKVQAAQTPWIGATPTNPVKLRPIIKNGRMTWFASVYYGQRQNYNTPENDAAALTYQRDMARRQNRR
jgi:hypothetical protein